MATWTIDISGLDNSLDLVPRNTDGQNYTKTSWAGTFTVTATKAWKSTEPTLTFSYPESTIMYDQNTPTNIPEFTPGESISIYFMINNDTLLNTTGEESLYLKLNASISINNDGDITLTGSNLQAWNNPAYDDAHLLTFTVVPTYTFTYNIPLLQTINYSGSLNLPNIDDSVTFNTIFNSFTFLPANARNIPDSATDVTWDLTGRGDNNAFSIDDSGITANGHTIVPGTLNASVGSISVDISITSPYVVTGIQYLGSHLNLTDLAPTITFADIFSSLAFSPQGATLPGSAADVNWSLTGTGGGVLSKNATGITANGNTGAGNLRASFSSVYVDISITSSGFSSGGANSNTCFVAGTPVNTDQGIIPIEQLDHVVNTMDGRSIVAISKITSTDSYLIHIPKDLLGPNMPSQEITISQLHKVLYNGVMTRAKEIYGVSKVAYDGQPLYNVLLETYGTMTVNNLTVETLHPQTNVAILYKHITTNNLCDLERHKLIQVFNKRLALGDDLRKAFFENIVLVIMLDVLLEPKCNVEVTPYSVMKAFVPQCCHVKLVEQSLGIDSYRVPQSC